MSYPILHLDLTIYGWIHNWWFDRNEGQPLIIASIVMKEATTFQFNIEYHFGKQRSIAIQQNARIIIKWQKPYHAQQLPWIHSKAAGTQRSICRLWNLCILLQCIHFKCSFVCCFLFCVCCIHYILYSAK